MTQQIFQSHRRRARRRATTLVEFALVCSMMMMLTLGMIQYGIVMNATLNLSQIARAAARYAAVHATENNYDTTIKAYVQQLCASSTIKYSDLQTAPGNIGISFASSTAPNTISTSGPRISGASVIITLSYPMSKKLFIPNSAPGLTRLNQTFVASSSMVIE